MYVKAIRYRCIFVVYMPENSEIPFGIGCVPLLGEIRARRERGGIMEMGVRRVEKKNFDLINF